MSETDERMAELRAQATRALRSLEKAERWLATPCRALDGERPLAVLQATDGMRRVAIVLGRIERSSMASSRKRGGVVKQHGVNAGDDRGASAGDRLRRAGRLASAFALTNGRSHAAVATLLGAFRWIADCWRLTPRERAAALGVPYEQYAHWERRGHPAAMTAETYERLGHLFAINAVTQAFCGVGTEVAATWLDPRGTDAHGRDSARAVLGRSKPAPRAPRIAVIARSH
jgi:hypothetical protein